MKNKYIINNLVNNYKLTKLIINLDFTTNKKPYPRK
jgi:hypothetical protein